MINENGVDTDDCTEWRGGKDRDGYGTLRVGSKYPNAYKSGWMLLHRYVYALGHGHDSIKGRVVRHLCHTPECSNLDHLEVGSIKDNNDDTARAGRSYNQKKTHCPQGHLYSEDNSYFYNNGKHRACITCQKKRSRKQYWDDPEKARKAQRRYREENRERVREIQRKSYHKRRAERLAQEAGQ